jgi:aldehyde:ferredoxin oxidoreductase
MNQKLEGMKMENSHHDGFAGKFLRLDLTTETATVEPFDPTLMQSYMGGRGVGAYFLYREVDPQIDAFDPANKVIIAPGPLTGTGIPAGTKTTVITKSPLTGGVAYSLASGSFGAWLKFAGYDFVIVEGHQTVMDSDRKRENYISCGR